jgi:hypothetical protein
LIGGRVLQFTVPKKIQLLKDFNYQGAHDKGLVAVTRQVRLFLTDTGVFDKLAEKHAAQLEACLTGQHRVLEDTLTPSQAMAGIATTCTRSAVLPIPIDMRVAAFQAALHRPSSTHAPPASTTDELLPLIASALDTGVPMHPLAAQRCFFVHFIISAS